MVTNTDNIGAGVERLRVTAGLSYFCVWLCDDREEGMERLVEEEEEWMLGAAATPITSRDLSDDVENNLEAWHYRNVMDEATCAEALNINLHHVDLTGEDGDSPSLVEKRACCEVLSRAAQDYATGLLERVVKLAKDRTNHDLRLLVKKLQAHGSEDMIVKWGHPPSGDDDPSRPSSLVLGTSMDYEGEASGVGVAGGALTPIGQVEPLRVIKTQDIVRLLGKERIRTRGVNYMEYLSHHSVGCRQVPP